MRKQELVRVVALSVVTAMLAACGGGHGGGLLPTGGGSQTTPTVKSNANFKAFIPAPATAKNGVKPKFISGQGTSSLVVSVVPTDPAEAAQWATLYGASGFTVCYNLFTNGVPATQPAGNGVTITPVVGPPAGWSVTFPFPSPPGQDSFTITQYAGACSATNPYAAPTPGPGQTVASQIISQSPPLLVNLKAGAVNDFNVQLSACNSPPGSGPINQPPGWTCSVPNPPGTTTITPVLGATVSYVYLANSTPALPITLPAPVPLPISEPIREQGAFRAATDSVGFPIPILGLDSNGNAVPYTAPVVPNTVPSSGLFPKAGDGVSITHTEVGSGANFKLYLIDATTGAVAQNTEPITLTQLNALDAADAKVGGVVGDPYVLVATFNGFPSTVSTSMTVTMNGKLNGVAITAQSTTITPQAALYTAVVAGPGTGYTDPAAPYTSAADILSTYGAARVAAGGQGYWVTDGGNMHLVNTGMVAVAGATKLTGETLDNNANLTAGQILAVDNAATAGAATNAAQASGVYVFDPVALTSKPLAVQDITTNNFVKIAAPQAIAFVPGGYVYVAAGNTVYVIDPVGDGLGGLATDNTGNFFVAEEIGTLPISGLSAGSDTGFDMMVSGTKLIFADTGNSRIVSVDTATCLPGGASCSPTVVATGAAFVGLSVNGSGYYATDTAGQIYAVSSTGSVTSEGLSNGGAPKDGAVGVLGLGTPVPVPYSTQGQTTNFFGSASVPSLPYDLAPFSAAGPVLAGAAQAAVVGAPLLLTPDTSNAVFGATAGNTTSGFGIVYTGSTVTNGGALTSNAILFTDNGSLRTLAI